MIKVSKAVIVVIIITSLHVSAGETIKIYTGDLPPWSISGGKGIFGDILYKLEKKVPYSFEIVDVPWSRAQMLLKHDEGSLIYPMTRTEKREKDFHWVLNVMPTEISFITINGKEIGLKEAVNIGTIIVHQDSPPHLILKEKKYKNIFTVPWGGEQPAMMLFNRRGDAWFSGVEIAKYSASKLGFRHRITIGPAIVKSDLYIASGLNFPADKERIIKEAFKTLIKTGVVKKIIDSYLN